VITTGGIGPTHDDITADAVAAAFGVELYEHPDIIAQIEERVRTRPGAVMNAAMRRMARVPVGADLVRSSVAAPPGFTIGNVFTLAGVPTIMRAMLEDVGHRLKGGVVTVSRTVRVEGSGESLIAAPLEAVAKAHPQLSLGSYPFFSEGVYGSNLVLRGRDPAELAATVTELMAALADAGVANAREVEAAA
jgi:molybdopterin-biosynthesis enzyme MoeA-like protein